MLRFPKSANPSVSQDQTVTEQQSFAMTQNTLQTYVNSDRQGLIFRLVHVR